MQHMHARLGYQRCSQVCCTLPSRSRVLLTTTRRHCCRCDAQAETVPLSGRRALLASSAGLALLPAAAHALIPDEDDEDLVQSAKSNRSQRLKEEKATENTYAKVAGLNRNDLASVQRAVNRLAKSGADIDSGKLTDVTTDISDKWVGQFEKAAKNIAGNDSSKSPGEVLQAITSLASSAKGGNLKEAKSKYIAAVSALQSWVSSSSLNTIKGL